MLMFLLIVISLNRSSCPFVQAALAQIDHLLPFSILFFLLQSTQQVSFAKQPCPASREHTPERRHSIPKYMFHEGWSVGDLSLFVLATILKRQFRHIAIVAHLVEVALKEAILNDAVLLELCLGVFLGVLGSDASCIL